MFWTGSIIAGINKTNKIDFIFISETLGIPNVKRYDIQGHNFSTNETALNKDDIVMIYMRDG